MNDKVTQCAQSAADAAYADARDASTAGVEVAEVIGLDYSKANIKTVYVNTYNYDSTGWKTREFSNMNDALQYFDSVVGLNKRTDILVYSN